MELENELPAVLRVGGVRYSDFATSCSLNSAEERSGAFRELRVVEIMEKRGWECCTGILRRFGRVEV